MSISRVYCAPLVVGETQLSPEEAHHLTVVRREKPGSPVHLFDGEGTVAVGTIRRVARRTAVVEVTQITPTPFELDYRLTLAFAVGKQQRPAYLIEKCTELGVFGLWPMESERSITTPGGHAIDKWRRRAIEAVKQSGRAWVPQFAEAQSFNAILDQAKSFDAVGICDTENQSVSIHTFFSSVASEGRVLLLVGPEGGWSDGERHRTDQAGVRGVSLGPTTLRTETAAIAVCAACAAASVRDQPA